MLQARSCDSLIASCSAWTCAGALKRRQKSPALVGFLCPGDTALVTSDWTKSNPTRLGSRGPREPLNIPADVTIVDASEVVTGFVEHRYFVDNEEVVRDVGRVLAGEAHDVISDGRYNASQNRFMLKS